MVWATIENRGAVQHQYPGGLADCRSTRPAVVSVPEEQIDRSQHQSAWENGDERSVSA
jgi:hypothetical protein